MALAQAWPGLLTDYAKRFGIKASLMPQSRLQKNLLRIDWDGLGQFQLLDVPLLFPQVAEIWSAAFSSVANLLILARETGLEPATYSLGSYATL